jgi:uncharacterized protein YuzB (UPF0349 family)
MTDAAKALMDRHPELFPERGERGFRGIECDDGWLDIIEEMCVTFEKLNLPVDICQIKEKFGQLRCYFNGEVSSTVENIVDFIEYRCRSICEVCGQPGQMVNVKMVLKTVCDEHKAALEARLQPTRITDRGTSNEIK